MKFIAHRGYWLEPAEKNTAVAFARALTCGFGIETDLRDHQGKLVVSHDPPAEDAMTANSLIDLFRAAAVGVPMALNIKSDGLVDLVEDFVSHSQMNDYFVFDLSVPDARSYLARGIPFFTRLSEFEITPSYLSHCSGVWLDAFESDWYGMEVIFSLVARHKQVAVVSPELHRRPHLPLWEMLRKSRAHESPLTLLCTDLPLAAREFFDV